MIVFGQSDQLGDSRTGYTKGSRAASKTNQVVVEREELTPERVSRARAQEMRQLLQAYPELMYQMPMGEDPYAMAQQMPFESMAGYGYY